MGKYRNYFLLAVCVLLVTSMLPAQRTTGQIFGKVVDDNGAALPGVSVVAEGPRLVGKATDITNALGAYRLLALPPGTYTIEYTLEGFKPLVRKDVVIAAEMTVTLDITMNASTIEEQITVVGKSPLIDVKSTTRGAAMNRQVFTLLPKGRNFDSLLVTVPGVQSESLLAGTSVDGASGAENMWYVDGISTTNLINGTSGQGVNFDFVEEVNFKSSGYNAEYGGSLGGVINVLTRSGGNEFHGEVLAYYTGEPVTARRRDVLVYNKYDTRYDQSAMYYAWEDYFGKQKWYNLEGGLNIGGYIIKDKLWFFASAIPNYNNYTRTLNYAIQGLTNPSRDVHQKSLDLNAQVKLSAQPLKNLRLTASFINNMSQVRGGATGFPSSYTGSTTLDYDIYDFDYPNWSASASADWIVTSNFMVSVRGGFFRTNQNNQVPEATTSPWYGFQMEQPYSYAFSDPSAFPEIPESLVHAPGWFNYPRANLLGYAKTIRQKMNFNVDLSYFATFAGEHAFKIGGQFIRQGEDVDQGGQAPIVYIAWDQDLEIYGDVYNRGKYGWYAVRGNKDSGPFGSVYNAFSNQFAFYVQDSWTIGQKLTINLGVRTESEYIPSYSQDPDYKDLKPIKFSFDKKISPRFGVIYDVFGDSSLKVFGSFAIYQDVMKLDVAANAFGGFKWKSAYYTLDDYDYTKIGVNGYFPGTLQAVFDFRAPSFDTVDPDIRPFTQREIAFGAEKKLGEDFSVSLRLVNKSVLYAVDDTAVVLPGVGEMYFYTWIGSPFIAQKYKEAKAAGLLPEAVPDQPKAKREYWALNFSFDKRLSNNWLMGFAATISSLRGNYSGLANSDEQGRNNPNGERSFDLWHFQYDLNMDLIDGPLATDRPIVLKLYGSYVFPMGLTVGAVMQAMSGTPITTAWNVDGPGYYPYNRGDLGRTPFLFYTDAYAEYNFKLGSKYNLQLSVNLSNVFNVETATFISGNVYRTNITPGDDVLVKGNWTPNPAAKKDGYYLKASSFFAPMQARFGVKFSF